MSTPKFPKKLYVKIEKDGDDHYYIAHDAPDTLVEMNENIKVGIYALVEIGEAEGVVVTKFTSNLKGG